MQPAMGGPGGEGPQNALLNQGQDNEMELFGYKTPTARKALCIVGYVLTLGFLLLLFYWKPEWDVWAQCTPCSLEEADTLLLRTTDEFKQCCKKKIFWIYLSSLNSKFSNVIMANEDSIINRAIMKPELKVRCIRVQKIKYVWLASEKCFVTVGALENKYSCSDIHEKFGSGLTQEERDLRSLVCGNNVIEVEIVPIWKLLFKEVLNPFNFFQIASLALWLEEGYTEYAIAIIVMTILSIIFTVYDLRQQSVKLHNLVESNNNVMVTALRKNGDCTTLESRHLVPGDIIVLTGKKLFLPCDTILLTGSCIVNEGMLTGESIPVTKTPLPDVDNGIPWQVHSGEDYKRHILFCGTEVIQTKPPRNGPATALVLQTGFCTAKGDMVRSILYPKPMNFKLYRDAFRFIMCLVAIAVVGMIYTVIVIKRQTDDVREIVVKALLIITVAIPPALPGALGVTMMYAQKRLKNKGIFCISPQRINICGRLNIVCFDKTGTLTEDGLDLWGVVPAGGSGFQDVYKFNAGHVMPWGPMVGAMASCHSLIIVDGKLQGDPLDMKMFEGTDWEIDASNMIHSNDDSATSENNVVRPGPKAVKAPIEGITILHQLPFSSSLQRMCVIAHLICQETCVVYMKGAPEKVVSFCRPETVPANFTRELQLYTLQGFRVIGLAQKPLELTTNEDLGNIKREVIEEDLEFLGLLVMENRLKKETRAVLQELNTANIRTVMITGDNLQTAVTVAKNSGLVSPSNRIIKVEAAEPRDAVSASITWQLMEDYTKTDLILSETQADQVGHYNPEYGNYNFAISGKSYEVIVQYFYDLLPKILMNGAIFARMSPGQKSNLIEEFQKLDYYVGMCGDGANDCGALKVAHAGISLSEQEASVASPFTSKTTNIECVPSLIREGRTALVGTFCVFKYMTLYAMIQFICMLLLYWQVKILLIYHYLLQDVGVTVAACLTMSLTCPYPKLAPYRPPAQLISPPLLLSVILNILYSLALQICGYTILQQQSWYNSIDHITCAPLNVTNNETTTIVGSEDDPASSETTTLWALTTINCIIVAFVFAKGRPFRKPIYTNYVFFMLLILQLGVMIFILFADFEGIYRRLEFVCTPVLWRVYVLVMLGILFIISFTTEEAVIENRKLWLLLKKTLNYYSKSQYRRLLRMLPKESNWPPLDQTDYADKIMVPTGYEEKVFVNAAYENEAGLTDRNHETRIPEQSPSTDVS